MSKKKKLFTVCAKINGLVYTDIEAESMDEALKMVKNDELDDPDWDSEEWTESPRPICVYNPDTGDRETV